VDAERNKANERAATAEKRAAEARAKQALTEMPSVRLQLEHASVLGRLVRMEGRLKRLLDFIPEQFKAFIRAIFSDRAPFTPERGREKGRSR